MLRHAFQHSGQAGAADALLARDRDFDAMTFQHLDHAPVRRYLENLAAACKFHRKSAIGAGVGRGGGEVFPMQVGFPPALGLGGVENVLHEAAGATHVEVQVVTGRRQDPSGIQRRGGVFIEVQENPVGIRRLLQAFDESGAIPDRAQ